jgi:hypothetical protein
MSKGFSQFSAISFPEINNIGVTVPFQLLSASTTSRHVLLLMKQRPSKTAFPSCHRHSTANVQSVLSMRTFTIMEEWAGKQKPLEARLLKCAMDLACELLPASRAAMPARMSGKRNWSQSRNAIQLDNIDHRSPG